MDVHDLARAAIICREQGHVLVTDEDSCVSCQRTAALVGQWLRAAVEAERAACEAVARGVSLPPDYQWSESNRQKFDFGASTAADADAARKGGAQ